MSDSLLILPVVGIKVSLRELFRFLFSKGPVREEEAGKLGFHPMGDLENPFRFRGFFRGDTVCKGFAFPEEFSCEFDIEDIEKAEQEVREEFEKQGKTVKPKFMLIQFMV